MPFSPLNSICLEGEKAVLKKLGYALAEPVRSGLVSKSEAWPGFSTLTQRLSGEAAAAFSGLNRTNTVAGVHAGGITSRLGSIRENAIRVAPAPR